jgi:hypothetical protein
MRDYWLVYRVRPFSLFLNPDGFFVGFDGGEFSPLNCFEDREFRALLRR